MSIPRPITVLTFWLIAGLLAAASPARAERAQSYNDAQLKLLFSDSKVVATGDYCAFAYDTGEPTLKFAFNADGTFSVDHVCEMGMSSHSGEDTGKWWVEDSRLCFVFSDSSLTTYLPSHKNCWPVRHGKSQFGLYAGGSLFWGLNVSHPQFPTKEKLLAALGELAGKTKTKIETVFLPPAEYKPLPVGTIVNYDKRTYTVQESRGFEIVVKESKKGYWQRPYAVFGRQGYDSYTFRVTYVWRDWAYDAFFDDKGKSALESLWPLTVGKKAELEFGEIFNSSAKGEGGTRPWNLSLEVLRTESLEIKGIQYPAYVVKVHAVSEKTGIWAVFPEQEYIETHWYNPDSGLVLKLQRDWIRGGKADSWDDYELVSATFPKGTTTHALKGTPISGEAQTAKATTLPPAPYKPLLVGTKIKYDDRIYRVTRTDGFLTTYRSITGNKLSYLNAYALFGEFADNLHVASPRDDAVIYDIDTGNRKKLETFWPLKVGKKTSFRLEEGGTIATQADTWKITLEVVRAEVIHLKGKKYPSYVIEERGLADSGKSYVGRKWYHPATGLIVKAERKWTKSFSVGGSYFRKSPHFAEGEVDNYTLVRVRFPEGAVAVAARQEPKAPTAVSAVDAARLKQAAKKARAEAARKARAQEIARLEREAEENRQAEAARQARAIEIARLKREAEAASRARKAEVSKASATEMARLKQEAEAVRRVHEAEIADLKHEAEVIRKAREARETVIANLKREAEETRKAREARDFEIASLRRQLDEFLKARKSAEAPEATVADGLAGIDFGNYHALVIGIDNYKNLPKLTTAINDARGVAKILKEEYGFKVSMLIDPDRLDIIDAFDEYRETLGPKDNLLIYYAGHGWLDEDLDRGYWLPVDAKPKRRGRWISNATITDTLKGLSAKHVMVVADSCYSGTLVRGADLGTRKRRGDYWKEMASKWARVAITSGGLEPVADKGGGKNSPFAKAFIDALRDNDSIIDGLQLFGKMRRPVMIAADQTPQYADVRQAGHDGGDFLFVRRK